ncbi:TOPRIM nucleotidyl transferase/hydrolase domain-containing protein [Actinokineospora sp. NBRC 105648]|uniref:TOPRIM nucleotidyl transferase/hydrolase domain-containing protein n=1 Tax=Actinokineospora sp. NBRC 105648 TaxID=3032206 RepID=UPI0024A2EBC8|nr:TOPRIM nucleotidyl transferase/hydrolase domain-containing protein [Actinokineospora sp. NBRC 105648]GLZ42818.1 hypothetical protein Acsp05_64420 [Actinokineospora sp. NBRC 105648]
MNGFRSLVQVKDVPIGSPTIVAGHNDGGKTALIDSLAFLLGVRRLEDVDRSYLSGTEDRCEATDVEGVFSLNDWERTEYSLPAETRIRRIADSESTVLQCWIAVPADTRLADLSKCKAPELKALVQELALEPAGTRMADNLAVLLEHARANTSGEAWTLAPKGLAARLPRILQFDGNAENPDVAVKAALTSRFQAIADDPDLRGRLAEIETDVKDRLCTESKSLRDHIMLRCPDLTDVAVDPDISFTHGFRGASLKISRPHGGPVDLTRSGRGSGRRISLAIWEWTSNLLAEQNSAQDELAEGGAPAVGPVQTIVYDEPDTHLDYAHQSKVMALILEQSAIPHVNVVVATHSMNLIDGVDIADVVHLKLESGRSVVELLGTETHENIDRFLGKIAASVGLRNTVLLHERFFLGVEGDTEQQAFPHLFRLSEGLSSQAAGIALWSCDNNEGALHLARYLHDHNRKVRILVDADSRTNPMFQDKRLAHHFGPDRGHIVEFVGEPDEVEEFEALFTDELWARVANQQWKRDKPWTADEFHAARGGKFSSIVQEMLQSGSETGPGGKPQMMADLALSLRSPEEVPSQLRQQFHEMRALAAE